MKEKKIEAGGVEYDVRLEDNGVLFIDGREFSFSELGPDLNEALAKYNYDFAPEVLQIRLPYGAPLDFFTKRFKKKASEARKSKIPLEPQEIEDILQGTIVPDTLI
jgi:hypothetical protein